MDEHLAAVINRKALLYVSARGSRVWVLAEKEKISFA